MKYLALLPFLAMMCGGSFLLWYEESHPPTHDIHIYIFAAIAIVGAAGLRPDSFFNVVKNFVVILGPYVPGGRRATDAAIDAKQPASVTEIKP